MRIFAWFRAFWAIMRQNRSKGLISARASEKKSQESDISPICPEVPRERIFFTKLGTNVPLVDVINWQILWQFIQGFKFYRRLKFKFFP